MEREGEREREGGKTEEREREGGRKGGGGVEASITSHYWQSINTLFCFFSHFCYSSQENNFVFTAKHVGTNLRHLVSLMTWLLLTKPEKYIMLLAKLNNEVPPRVLFEPNINTTCVCLSPLTINKVCRPILNPELLMQCKHTVLETNFLAHLRK